LIDSTLHVLTVFYEDVLHLASKTILENVPVAFYHVGAEDSLIMFHSYVDTRQSQVPIEHSGAPFLRTQVSDWMYIDLL